MGKWLQRNWVAVVLVLALGASAFAEHDGRVASEYRQCIAQLHVVREVNQRTPALITLRDGMLKFNAETRRARSDKHGSSYDPHFVRVIDGLTPALQKVDPKPIPEPDCS